MSLRRVFAVDARLGARIVHLATPVMVAMLVQTLINVADTFLVGQLPKEVATPGQAALEVSILLLWFFGGFLGAISVGTQALTARRVGERDDARAGHVLTNSFAIAMTASAVLTIALWIATPWLFPILNDNPAVVAVGLPYWRWRLLALPSMVGMLAVKSFFDGIGQTKVHMVVSIIINVANLILAYGLIFGRLGMPHMEVEGAGVAAFASSYLGFALILGALLLRTNRMRFAYLRMHQLSRGLAMEIVRLSLPSGIATMVMMTGFGLMYRIVAEADRLLGTGVVNFTATSIIVRVLSLFFIAAIGYGTATATLVSQSMGEGKPDMASRYAWESARIGVYGALVLGALTVSCAGPILRAFTHDAEVIEMAIPALRLAGCFEPLMVVGLVMTQAHFGAGNTRLVMRVELVLHFLCLVPLSYLLGVTFSFGLMGVWCAVGCYMFLLAFVLSYQFNRGHWRAIRI